jgi:phosphatidylglycerol:prolipoprotein diacylglycerol transferase
MLPYINVFGRIIPAYGLIGIAGILLGGFIGYFRGKKYGASVTADDALFMYIYGVIGTFIGAKIFSVIQNLPAIINDIGLLAADPALFAARYLTAGLVFYGGLIGAFAGVLIYAKQYKILLSPCLALLVPVMPLAHAVGRIGCFTAGCCYGTETHSALGIMAADGLIRLPVQLFESMINLVLFMVLSAVSVYRRGDGRTVTGLYFVLYAAARFCLEFIRGDAVRGFIGPLSVGQVFSIIIFAAGAILLSARRKSRR